MISLHSCLPFRNFLFLQKLLLVTLGTEECITKYLPIRFEINATKIKGSVVDLLEKGEYYI